jgi:large subunit ribosomal protein L5
MVRLKEKYSKEIAPALRESQGYKNPMQVPRVSKVVINMGVKTSDDRDAIKALVDDLGKITGQQAVITKARKSISNFRLREGMPVGIKVTLRGVRMFEFLDRLLNVALPRIRDFRGVSATAFDGRGNYTLGLQEQTIFPEINPDHVKKLHGMDITIVTTANTNDEAKELLKLMGMPFETTD